MSAPDLLRAAERAIRDGRVADAASAYAQALAVDPARPDAWFNRAWAERAERRFEDALASYEQAITRGVVRPEEAHVNRAAILADHLFRPEEARIELEAALRLNGRFVQAWLNLGNLEEDLGHPDEARRAYRSALAVDPSAGRAHARLGAIDAATGDPDRAAAALKAALPLIRTADDRAELLFSLGSALDAAGEYGEAWQAVEAANWIAHRTTRTRYDPRAQEALVDRLIRAFPDPEPAAPGPAPVFICGMFRSGSTLAERLLGRHPAVTAGGELETIPALANSLQPYPESVLSLSNERRGELRVAYLRELGAVGSGLVTDKRPDNFAHIGLIKKLFPAARIVHTRRRPLDNLLSVWFLHFGEGVPYGHDLGEAAHHFIQYRRLMDHWRALYPESVHDFDYDRAVVDPRGSMGDLLGFLGLPWDDACLGKDAVEGPVRTASAWAVRQPLHARSSGRWRNYAQQLGEVRRVLEAAGIDPEA